MADIAALDCWSRRARVTMGRQVDATHRVIEAVWRQESAVIVARVARLVGDISTAEDVAQDALLAALQQWPGAGVPDNPGAWLMTIAKRRAIDVLRKQTTAERKTAELVVGDDLGRRDLSAQVEAILDDPIGDDLLRLIFICCHPVLPPEARVALTLRLLGGLTTDEIARAFMAASPTIGQRITRAKRTIADHGIKFEVPPATELSARLASVLEVVYLIFNEGYAATAGDDWARPALCHEAIRLGEILAGLASEEPEVLSLLALMNIQASRLNARVDATGQPVLLLDQDRSRWDRQMIDRGLAALDEAKRLGGRGPYTLQAEIAACHARAGAAEDTDWLQIAQLYDELMDILPTPVVALNRAVAVSRAHGPGAGLALVEALEATPQFEASHLLASVRADLLAKLGRVEEARREFERAAALTRNAGERELLRNRAAELPR